MLPTMEAQHDALADREIGGKSLAFIARGSVETFTPGPDKQVFDVVTDDGVVYRFEQQRPGEPYTFAPNNAPNRARRSGRLPGVVEAILESEFLDADGASDPGYVY